MAYTLIHKNPLSNSLPNPDIIVNYDHNQRRFCVTIVATNSCYYVMRDDLIVKSLIYKDLIIQKIISGCELSGEPGVYPSPTAENEIHMIWLENLEVHK